MPSWVKLGCQNGEEMKRKGVEMREAAGKKKWGRVFVGGHITAGSSHEAAVIGGLHRRPKPPTGGDARRWHHITADLSHGPAVIATFTICPNGSSRLRTPPTPGPAVMHLHRRPGSKPAVMVAAVMCRSVVVYANAHLKPAQG